MNSLDYYKGWFDCIEQLYKLGKQPSGVFDKNGKMIYADDTVSGLFYHSDPVTGTCAFRDGAFGVKWMRGDVEEFTAFCQCCNVKWEVQDADTK